MVQPGPDLMDGCAKGKEKKRSRKIHQRKMKRKKHNTTGQASEPDKGFTGEQNELEMDPNTVLSDEDLNKLFESHLKEFRHRRELDDIRKAIGYGNLALNKTPDKHPDLSHRHASLGISYNYRFKCLGNRNDLEKAIEHGSRALELTPDTHWHKSVRHADLAEYYTDRFELLGSLDELNKAIEHDSRALQLIPGGHPDESIWHSNLGVFYLDRFRRLGSPNDVEKAIEHGSRALELTPNGHPDKSIRHSNLGVFYLDRFRRLGNLNDLDRASEHDSRALGLTPNVRPANSIWHPGPGAPDCDRFRDRFRRLGNPRDLEKAIEDNSKGHSSLGASGSNRSRFLGESDLNDPEKAIKHDSPELELTPNGDTDEPGQLISHLGEYYGHRFRLLDDLGALEKAIEYESRALELTADGHPLKSIRHSNLAVSYGDRFQRLGNPDDLEKAIEHDSRALELTPDGHPDKPIYHSNLAVSYGDRCQHLGSPDDLEKAIEHGSRALALTPDGHPDKSIRHSNLGVSYGDRFQRLGNLDDLEKAIKHDSLALELNLDVCPDNSIRHSNLAVSYGDRFQRLTNPDDLEKAIKHSSIALELTPDDHPDKAGRHSNLAVYYGSRFRCMGDSKDLKKAIKHDSLALELTPDGHPETSNRYSYQAETFLSQYQHTRNPSHFKQSMDSFRKASQSLAGGPRSRFQNALRWASVTSTHSPKSPDCIEAYRAAINLLPQFIWLGATTSQRYYDLLTVENLAVCAAHVAILNSNRSLALEWLEHARCVVWNQTIMLRSPVDDLKSSYPDLASRLQTVSRHLHSDNTGPSTTKSISSSAGPDSDSRHRYRLAREYENLIAHIRTLPGHKDFLLPMRADHLVLAARTRSIVVINCHIDRCEALLILPGQDCVKHVLLPNFTEAKARTSRSKLEAALRYKGLRERGVKSKSWHESSQVFGGVLTDLWNNIVKPVLDFLGYTNIYSDNLPHITWCPTGTLTFLPLHAAGDYNQPRSRVFNYVVSSYIPTLTALLASTPTSSSCSPRILAIGQAHTPGRKPLPGTTKELGYVKIHTSNRAKYTQLVNEQATKAEVLDAMEHHDWVHLACHAHQNISDPTKSGFHLHDGILDLASISRQSFKHKGLAFLSACQTATGDEKLPDEAIHLASGMLMAGYPSVIATMWSVMDSDAPLVAGKVYAELMMRGGKIGNGEPGKALHHAVAALREKVGEKEFARWVPYVHIGS